MFECFNLQGKLAELSEIWLYINCLIIYMQTKTLSICLPKEHLFTAVIRERVFDIDVTLIGRIR